MALAELDRTAEACTSTRWTPEHIRLGTAANSVARRLRDIANCALMDGVNPALPRLLIELAAELRRGFRPNRAIPARERDARKNTGGNIQA